MKFLLIMRTTDEAVVAHSEAGVEQMLERMGRYNEDLVAAGVLAGGEGLTGASEGAVVDFSSDPPLVTSGAYGDSAARFNGYWVVEVDSLEAAIEWARRCPLGPGSKLEIRRIAGAEDFPADNEWVEKEAQWRAAGERRLSDQARSEAERGAEHGITFR